MKVHHDTGLGLAFFVGDLLLVVGVTDERQHGSVGAGGRLDDVWHEAFLGLLVMVGQILATTGIFRLAVFPLLDDEFVAVADEFALHVGA